MFVIDIYEIVTQGKHEPIVMGLYNLVKSSFEYLKKLGKEKN